MPDSIVQIIAQWLPVGSAEGYLIKYSLDPLTVGMAAAIDVGLPVADENGLLNYVFPEQVFSPYYAQIAAYFADDSVSAYSAVFECLPRLASISNSVVEVEAHTIQYYQKGNPAWLIAVPTKNFTDLEGRSVLGGSYSSSAVNNYQKVPVVLSGNGVYQAQPFVGLNALSVTYNTEWNSGAGYTFYLTDAKFKVLETIYKNLPISDAVPSVTLADLEKAKNLPKYPYRSEYTPLSYFKQRLAELVNMATRSSATTLGASYLSRPAVDPDIPIAVGVNEPSYVAGLQKKYLRSYNSLASALAANPSNPTKLIVDNNIAVAASVSIPKHIEIEFQGNSAGFTVANGQTLTIGLLSNPGNKRVFFGSGDTVIGRGAVNELNLAWWAGITPSSDDSNAFRQMFASLTANAGGTARIPVGQWRVKNLPTTPNYSIITGCGSSTGGSSSATTITVIPPNVLPTLPLDPPSGEAREPEINCLSEAQVAAFSYGFKLLGNSRNITFRDLCISGENVRGTQGVLFSSINPQVIINTAFENVAFNQLEIGTNLHSQDNNALQIAQTAFTTTRWNACKESVRCNTNNAGVKYDDCYISINPGCGAFNYLKSGIVSFDGIEFAGVALPPGQREFTPSGERNPFFQDSYILRVSGENVSINAGSFQDEGVGYFLIIDRFSYAGAVNVFGGLVQSLIQLNGSCIVNLFGTQFTFERCVRDAPGVAAYVNAIGTTWSNYGGFVRSTMVDAAPLLDRVAENLARLDNFVGFSKLNGQVLYNNENQSRLFQKQIVPNIGSLARAGNTILTPEVNRILESFALSISPTNESVKDDGDGNSIQHDARIAADYFLEYLSYHEAGRRFLQPVEINGTLDVANAAVFAQTATVGGLLTAGNIVSEGNAEVNEIIATGGAQIGGGSISGLFKGNVTIDPASIAANFITEMTATLAGAAVGDAVHLNPPSLPTGIALHQARISATNTVAYTIENTTASLIDIPSGTWRYTLVR